MRTLQARLTAGQIVWVAALTWRARRAYRFEVASPRGSTNISQVAALALGLSHQLVRGRTAFATDRPPAELVARLASRLGLDGALRMCWT